MLNKLNEIIVGGLIKNFHDTDNKQVMIRYGLVSGWFSIVVIILLFVVKIILGLMANSISIIATAFHLLSHLANSIILVVTFHVTARPATEKNPFGHGRMEHISPLIMAIFLFVSGIYIGESSIHQAIEPHEIYYWAALPWILLGTIITKLWLAQFVRFLAERVKSQAIHANATHHIIEAVMTFFVICGLIIGHSYDFPEIDGYIGIVVSLWILYLGYTHARHSIVPILGVAPSHKTLQKIRETAKTVEGVYDVHETIVHDYGSLYIISLHAEIPEKYGPAKMHEIAEVCEGKLRKAFGGETVCHTDPLSEITPETEALEKRFAEIADGFPRLKSYHRFRVINESPERIIVAADINLDDKVLESDYASIAKTLEKEVMKKIPNVAYCAFYVTPKFAY